MKRILEFYFIFVYLFDIDEERKSQLEDPFLDMFSSNQYECARKKDIASESQGKVKKIVVVIVRGEMLLAVILHVVYKFYGGEYDPLYVERVKQTLFMLYDEKLTNIIKQNFNEISLSTPYYSAKLMNKAPPLHLRIPKKSLSKKGQTLLRDGDKKHERSEFNEHNSKNVNKNIFEQPRVSLIRSSELLSHERKNKPFGNKKNSTPKLNEYSSFADQSVGGDEEEKISLNMTMKAPLNSSELNLK